MKVDVALFSVGGIPLALEVADILSLVEARDVTSSKVIDLGVRWGLSQPARPKQVAILARNAGALSLGLGATIESWDRGRIYALPEWIGASWPRELRRLCGLGEDGHIVLVIDPEGLGTVRSER